MTTEFIPASTLRALRARRMPRLRRQVEPINNWPGRGHGVRPPKAKETPLSIAEVVVGVRNGVIRAD